MSLRKASLVLVALLGLSVFGGSAQNFDTTSDYEYEEYPTTKVYDLDDVAVVCTTGLGCSRGQEKVSPATTPSTTVKAPRLPLCKAKPKVVGPTAEALKPLGPCYVSETKAAKLSAQLTSLVQALSADGGHQQGEESRIKNPVGENEGLKTICSSSRINQITQDLSEVASQLWSLANRLRNVSESEVQELNEKTGDLIRRLREIRVFAGLQLTSDAVLLQSFEAQVEHLESNFNSTLALLKLQRPARPPIVVKPRIRTKTTGPNAISAIQRQLLQPGISPAEFAALAQQHPKEAAEALPQLLANMYSGNQSNFDATFQFIKSLPTIEQKVQGYVTLYGEMRRNSQLDTYELTRLLVQVKQTSALPSSASTALQSEFAQLKQDYAEFMPFFGRSHSCDIRSVALARVLFTVDPSWPEYAVLRSDSLSNKLPFEPQNGGLTFRIRSGDSLLHARRSSTYGASKRHIMETSGMSDVPSDAWKDWKLVPVNDGKNFKILNAQHNEVMFVDPSATHGGGDYRRVFLKRYDYSGDVPMPVNGDLWSLECTL